jgi:hypothetical protein
MEGTLQPSYGASVQWPGWDEKMAFGIPSKWKRRSAFGGIEILCFQPDNHTGLLLSIQMDIYHFATAA